MKVFLKFASLSAASLVFMSGQLVHAEGQVGVSTAEVDNSKVNERDNGVNASSADQQSNTANDVETTRKIRKAITSDSSLSSYGHNVKIITEKGDVVLKGPVHSASEKQKIETITDQIVGRDHFKSELTVKQ